MGIETQRYYWKAWYSSTALSEYNGLHEAPFSSIQKDQLLRFGLESRDEVVYYDIHGGEFTIKGHAYSFRYAGINLNQPSLEYRDIIQFKDAMSGLSMKKGIIEGVVKHTFGWKNTVGSLRVQILYEIPIDDEPAFKVKLVAPIDMFGLFEVLKDGRPFLSIEAPLQAGRSGEARITL